MNMEHWWNDNDSGNGSIRREKSVPLPLCIPKSHTSWSGLNPCFHCGRLVTNLPQPWHNPIFQFSSSWMLEGHVSFGPHFVTATFPLLKANWLFFQQNNSKGTYVEVLPCTNKFRRWQYGSILHKLHITNFCSLLLLLGHIKYECNPGGKIFL